jgi:undecaprenyl-diphosphatase
MLHHIRARVAEDPWWHVWGLTTGLLFAILLMFGRLYPHTLDRIDSYVEAKVVAKTITSLEPYLVITVLGGAIGITLGALLLAYLFRRNRFNVLQLALLMLFTGVSMGIAKAFVERARPDTLLWLDPLNTYSFPSGHAALSTALYGYLAVNLYRRIHTKSRKQLAVAACILVIVLVCLSRLVLSYHYLTDVIGGVLLGLFWLSVIYMLPRKP